MGRKKKITQEELDKRINLHGKWLRGEEGGRKLDLSKCSLSELYFSRANLTQANLRGANLNGADLTGANLTRANLTRADLTGANLTDTNLGWVNLRGVNLSEVNLDFAVWPLWCGSAHSNIKVDKKIAAQLLYHACIIAQQHIKIPKTLIKFVENYFHRYSEVEKLEGGK